MTLDELRQRVLDQQAEVEALKALATVQAEAIASLVGLTATALRNHGDLQERLVEHMRSLNQTLEVIGKLQDATGDDSTAADWWKGN